MKGTPLKPSAGTQWPRAEAQAIHARDLDFRGRYNQFNSPGLAARLWEKVDKSGDCWLWLGSLGHGGRYGSIHRGDGMVPAHRVAYELTIGPIPAGMEIDHLCRTPRCVRPDHLEPVTHRENMRRGRLAQAVRDRGYRCVRHDELMIVRSGVRCCRTCRIEINRRYRARKRAAA